MWLTSLATSFLGCCFGSLFGILLCTALFLLFLWISTSKPANLPPGPIGLPFVGYMPFLKPAILHQQLRDISRKYGPIITVYFGRRLTVILNDYESNRKCLVEHADTFSGRPPNMLTHVDPLLVKNFVFNDGILWREQRRFALQKFRDFGMGKSCLEPAIVNEIAYFLDEVEKSKNQDLDIRTILTFSVCNNTLILNFGKRLEYSDPVFLKLKTALDSIGDPGGLLERFFSWLDKIPIAKNLLNFEKIRSANGILNDYMRQQIRQHEREYNENDESDYINAYITERKRREKTKNFAELFDDDALVSNLKVLFQGAMETTTVSLRWAILYMILHQDMQRQVQKEIDEVIGNMRTPSYEDRLRMPYTEAVLMEVQRVGSIIPLSVMHRTIREVEVEGYVIPKDTCILINIWAVNNDERLFPDPQSFRPERFLDKDGKVIKSEHIMSFSLGKRACMGEPLARMEMFLYFTSLFQRFTLLPPKCGATLSAEAIGGGMNMPKQFQAHIISRNSQ